MDAFEDGKFPLGTDCSLGSNKHFKAYCVNGKCIRFDENGLPFDQGILFSTDDWINRWSTLYLLLFSITDSKGMDQVKMLFKREMQMRSRFGQFKQLTSQSMKEGHVNSWKVMGSVGALLINKRVYLAVFFCSHHSYSRDGKRAWPWRTLIYWIKKVDQKWL